VLNNKDRQIICRYKKEYEELTALYGESIARKTIEEKIQKLVEKRNESQE